LAIALFQWFTGYGCAWSTARWPSHTIRHCYRLESMLLRMHPLLWSQVRRLVDEILGGRSSSIGNKHMNLRPRSFCASRDVPAERVDVISVFRLL
jgi:hypothetical protein